MSIKLAIIGAGSVTFARRLIQDILSVPELVDTTLALMDINEQYLDLVARLVERDIEANKLPARVIATTDRRQAIEGADYVVNTTRIGGLEAFQLDVDIPLKYGVDQCVGDTLCAGGIMYGQRNIPQILAFCKDIREVARPGALFLNYANPNAMNTWAASKYGGVRTVGLCHGVHGGHWQIAQVIELLVNDGRAPESPGYRGGQPDGRRDAHRAGQVAAPVRGGDREGEGALLQREAAGHEDVAGRGARGLVTRRPARLYAATSLAVRLSCSSGGDPPGTGHWPALGGSGAFA
jgi:hypothetical protein